MKDDISYLGVSVKGRDVLVDVVFNRNDGIYPPHIHIYNTSERKIEDKSFDIEVDLAYLMWTGDVSHCRILDRYSDFDVKVSSTDWEDYLSYLDVIEYFLFKRTVYIGMYLDYPDNVAVAIQVFNEDADLSLLSKEHKKLLKEKFGGHIYEQDMFLAVLYCYGNKIHKDFHKYFNSEQRQKFKELF